MPGSFLTPAQDDWGSISSHPVRTTPLNHRTNQDCVNCRSLEGRLTRLRERHSAEQRQLRTQLQETEVERDALKAAKKVVEEERDDVRVRMNEATERLHTVAEDLRNKSGAIIALYNTARRTESELARLSLNDPGHPAVKFLAEAIKQFRRELRNSEAT